MDIHVLRNLVMRYGVELTLTSVEKECLWHLLDHDHDGKGYCYPSEKRIASQMGISERYVRSVIDRLARQHNLISVIRRVGTSNQYRYHGIMKAMIPMLQRETGKGKKRVEKSVIQLELLDGHRNPSSAPLRNPSSAPLRNPSSAPSGTPVPPNSASELCNMNPAILTQHVAPVGATREEKKFCPLKFEKRDMKAAEWMLEELRNQNPNFKTPALNTWANEIRLIREQDRREYSEIVALWTWARNDPFWMSNILSPRKLREKWDQLWMKKNAPAPGAKQKVNSTNEIALSIARGILIQRQRNGDINKPLDLAD